MTFLFYISEACFLMLIKKEKNEAIWFMYAVNSTRTEYNNTARLIIFL